MGSQKVPYPSIPQNALNMNYIHSGSNFQPERPFRDHFKTPLVRAATELRIDSFTEIIDVNNICQSHRQYIQCIEITTSSNGVLHSLNRIDTSWWVKIVSIAKDCQSSNVLLMSTEKGVYLKTIKLIAPGEPLLMWFTEQILGTMNIPIHLPIQILGHNSYTCHICKFSFEGPNLLKLHLALKCNHFAMSLLWHNLAKGFEEFKSQRSSQSSPPSKIETPSFSELSRTYSVYKPYSEQHIVPATAIRKKKELIWNPYEGTEGAVSSATELMANESSVNTNCPTSSTSKPLQIQPNSAFRPYEKPCPVEPTYLSENSIWNYCEGIPGPSSERRLFIPARPSTPLRPAMQFRLPVLPLNSKDAAQIENVYSKCARRENKFTCQFCGNSFSRKYGLKIHIRTHTGYKPLKCPVCPKSFGDPSNLNKHIRLHSDPNSESPYKCQICGKVLVRRRDLSRHMQSRHQEDNSGNNSDKSSEA